MNFLNLSFLQCTFIKAYWRNIRVFKNGRGFLCLIALYSSCTELHSYLVKWLNGNRDFWRPCIFSGCVCLYKLHYMLSPSVLLLFLSSFHYKAAQITINLSILPIRITSWDLKLTVNRRSGLIIYVLLSNQP